MTRRSDKALIIFLKNPEPGKVKTRLEAGLGQEATLLVYRRLISLTLEAASGSGADVFVYFGSKIPENTKLPDSFHLRVQESGPLGHRMSQAFKELLSEGYENICIIGSDCPQLRTRHLDDAFASLSATDITIGPAEDGGYYLLGMNADYTWVFELEKWSHSQVYNQTLELIKEHKASYTQLERLSDLDDIDDYHKLAHHLDPFEPAF